MSATMFSTERLCPKDVRKEITDVIENTLADQQDNELKQTSSDAEILEYKEIVEIQENKKSIRYR